MRIQMGKSKYKTKCVHEQEIVSHCEITGKCCARGPNSMQTIAPEWFQVGPFSFSASSLFKKRHTLLCMSLWAFDSFPLVT